MSGSTARGNDGRLAGLVVLTEPVLLAVLVAGTMLVVGCEAALMVASESVEAPESLAIDTC